MAFNSPKMNYLGQEWAALKGWLQNELEDCYKELAGTQCTEVKTQQLRGRASLIVTMLDFPANTAAGKPQN